MDEQQLETTIYSLSEVSPTADIERREADRHLTLYRVGSMTIGRRRELCLIRNISAGGMLIRTYCAMHRDMPISIELKSGTLILGRVSWIRDLDVGVTFDKPIDLINILSASMDGPLPRMPRVEVACFATVREGAFTYRMQVCDISQGGIKLGAAAKLPLGSGVVVTLPGLAPTPGVVRWSDKNSCGVTFNRLVALPALVNWLQGQRDGVRNVG